MKCDTLVSTSYERGMGVNMKTKSSEQVRIDEETKALAESLENILRTKASSGVFSNRQSDWLFEVADLLSQLTNCA